MRIISSPIGFVLMFSSIKELEGVIEHLSGMLEWDKKERVDPPYLYAMFDDHIPHEEINELLEDLKPAPPPPPLDDLEGER